MLPPFDGRRHRAGRSASQRVDLPHPTGIVPGVPWAKCRPRALPVPPVPPRPGGRALPRRGTSPGTGIAAGATTAVSGSRPGAARSADSAPRSLWRPRASR